MIEKGQILHSPKKIKSLRRKRERKRNGSTSERLIEEAFHAFVNPLTAA
jgi:hypothetical protein